MEEDVAGHRCLYYTPSDPSPHGCTVIYLHDLAQANLADHPEILQQVNRHGFRLACPQTGPSWWSDRLTPSFDPALTAETYVVEHVLPAVLQKVVPDVVSPAGRVALAGFGMGGQGALRIAYKHPNQFPVVVAVTPAIDFQQRIDEGDPVLSRMYSDAERARQDTATLHIHPLNWPRHQWFCCDPTDYRWHDSAERLRMKLYSLGVPHECDLETAAGGHSWAYFHAMAEPALQFVADRLEQERLREV